MYLREIEITNIRALRNVKWSLPKDHKGAGWHVILGDNGSGKSSFLQAVSLALIGPEDAGAGRIDYRTWLRGGEVKGDIRLQLKASKSDRWVGKQPGALRDVKPSVRLERAGDRWVEPKTLANATQLSSLERGLWSREPGWFSASFGPFRRFEGGDEDSSRLFGTAPKLAPHLSLFSERVALTESIAWLCRLYTLSLQIEKDRTVAEVGGSNAKVLNKIKQLAGFGPTDDEIKHTGSLLGFLKRFVNDSGLLPGGVKLEEIRADQVIFCDAGRQAIAIGSLSDGFRTALSLTFELFRLMVERYSMKSFLQHVSLEGSSDVFVKLPGVVLIDEVDAHLHPTWQHRIGEWFKRSFPNIQFIVTTHSPIICQAAEGGTVFKLPQPGTDEEARMIEGLELQRLVYGSVLDAYRTSAFDSVATQSESARKLLEELATLNVKEIAEGLSEEEQLRQQELRTILPGRDPKRVGG
jgi:predicted ATPase